MFAVQCSFCQHENVPGARFCAECGSPLHLRVCPNSNCGKVSDVNAKQCKHCGTFFPEIPLADASTPAKATPAARPQPATERKQGVSALPLIIVAIVAGGLPLLWINRSHLPAPKNWQPDPVGSAATTPPEPAPFPVPPPVTQPASALPPLQVSAPAEPDADKAAAEKATTEKAAAEKAAREAEAESVAKAEKEKAAKAKAAREAKALKAKEAREATAAAEAQRPCTEAIAAVGLCDPKQIKK